MVRGEATRGFEGNIRFPIVKRAEAQQTGADCLRQVVLRIAKAG